MCLEIYSNRKPKAKRATEEIVAYKVMLDISHSTPDYVTPYTLHPWNPQINKELKVGLFVPIDIRNCKPLKDEDRKCWRIGRGVIHTFRTLKGAQTYGKLLFNGVIWKVVIPKGTRYFENKREYASRKIRFVKEVQWTLTS